MTVPVVEVAKLPNSRVVEVVKLPNSRVVEVVKLPAIHATNHRPEPHSQSFGLVKPAVLYHTFQSIYMIFGEATSRSVAGLSATGVPRRLFVFLGIRFGSRKKVRWTLPRTLRNRVRLIGSNPV